jgi:phosphoserine aminotransferase
MNRVYNFSAGPSMLPLPVLERAASEMTHYQDSGMSVMEMSHRSAPFMKIMDQTQDLMRSVLKVPKDYKILMMQGGATNQFSAVPLNLMTGSKKADYVISGHFSKKAYQEARRYGDVRVLASSEEERFRRVPEFTPEMIRDDADYVHICYNNTIYGSRFPGIPETGSIPLVADVSSCILSEPIDLTRFSLVYAGAQKNMAPAGLTVVIVHEDLLGHEQAITPIMLNYKIASDNNSLYNTPPCYAIYIAMCVLEWLRDEIGGLENMALINRRKAKKLYDYLDQSTLFHPSIDASCRSMMNVTFMTENPDLDLQFCREAEAIGLVNLKGHRVTGGIRASIYNAMPEAGIDTLINFMETFERKWKNQTQSQPGAVKGRT